MNGRLAAGVPFCEALNSEFLVQELQNLEKLEHLRKVILADMHFLTGANRLLLSDMQLLPNLALLLSGDVRMKTALNYNEIFTKIHNVIVHMLGCQEGVLLLLPHAEILLKCLQRNEREMLKIALKFPAVFEEEVTAVYLREFNFNSKIDNTLNLSDCILNQDYHFYQNTLPLEADKKTVLRGLFSVQLSLYLKYHLSLLTLSDKILAVWKR